MDFNDNNRKIAIELILKINGSYPLYLKEDYLDTFLEIFNGFGLKNFSFSGPLSKKVVKTKSGLYFAGNTHIIFRTFYDKNFAKLFFEMSSKLSREIFKNYNLRILTQPITLSNRFFVINKSYDEITPEMSETIRSRLIEKYKLIFEREPNDNRFIAVENKNKVYLYGSNELILVAKVLGLLGENGYKNFLIDEKDKRYLRSVLNENSSIFWF